MRMHWQECNNMKPFRPEVQKDFFKRGWYIVKCTSNQHGYFNKNGYWNNQIEGGSREKEYFFETEEIAKQFLIDYV